MGCPFHQEHPVTYSKNRCNEKNAGFLVNNETAQLQKQKGKTTQNFSAENKYTLKSYKVTCKPSKILDMKCVKATPWLKHQKKSDGEEGKELAAQANALQWAQPARVTSNACSRSPRENNVLAAPLGSVLPVQ